MKQNTFYIIPILCLLLLLSSCKEDFVIDNSSRQIVVNASLEELHTRVSLDQKDGSLDLIAKWNAKDKVSLYIIQGKKGYKLNPVTVQNISSDGKNCDIVFQLPSAVIAESPYDIYGLCDADGEILEEESMVSVRCELQRMGWNERKTPVWFHAKGGSLSLKANFRHLGTYEILHITNNSKSQCAFVHAGFDVETPWYKSSDFAPLSDSYDPAKMPGEPGDDARMRSSIPISSGETASVLSWYIPNGVKVKDARLIAEFGGKRVLSENTLSSEAKIQVGHAYHMYATWDGEKLMFGEGEEEEPEQEIKTETITVKGVSFKMVAVEGGSFLMGAEDDDPEECYDDELPRHQVSVSSFAIGQTEVTQQLWKAVMGNNPSVYKGDKLPVEEVSWEECQTFISKLNSLTGRTFRLPTEAEWEYAARGGKLSKGYKFAGSNDVNAVAWNCDNSDYETHTVASKKPNELGLYDMSGNVWEWCLDWYDYDYYDYSPINNPCNTKMLNEEDYPQGDNHIHRGGSVEYIIKDLRNAMRGDFINEKSNSLRGLRLVISNVNDFEKNDPAVEAGLCPDTNHPHVIDMGKAGKWACCNVGAKVPWGYGYYYAWGETWKKSYYEWSNYEYCDGDAESCYNIGNDIAGTKYDVAHVKWGGKWHMPSHNQQKLLCNNCSSEWTSVNGINGRKFTATNGGTIFLPAAGSFFDYVHNVGSYGRYWSSSTNSDLVHRLDVDSYGTNYQSSYEPPTGCSVRPVAE